MNRSSRPDGAHPIAGRRDADVLVVGAGPAGSAAAIAAARTGQRVLLIERGPFPGSKNMYGGVVYGRVLDGLIPRWWEEAPVQRWVTRRQTMMMTPTQAFTLDFRTETWGDAPYNGATAYRPDFDRWLARKAVDAGARLITSTTVTGLLRDSNGHIIGVHTDRDDGDVTANVVIAADGVNSFLAKEAGLYPETDPHNYTVGVKETLSLPSELIDERFGVRGDHGVDIEIIGCTGDIPGGGFVYTNRDTVSIGVVLELPGLARGDTRPEQLIAELKAHPAIAPLVEGGEVIEYSAHVIPEGGYDMMPEITTDGMIVAGDAAALCLAAGLWLEGVNFAIGSGVAAGQSAAEAVRRGDVTAAGLAGYRRRLESNFVLRDHKRLRGAPGLVMSERVQQQYPELVCAVMERMFHVDNPEPKPGVRRIVMAEAKRLGISLRDLAKGALAGGTDIRVMAMNGAKYPPLSFEARMGLVDFRVDDRAHITVDGDKCGGCTTKGCVTACPADLFVPTSDGGILFNYEQCFECGTCYLVCNVEGAISWSYPTGGHGVVFRRS